MKLTVKLTTALTGNTVTVPSNGGLGETGPVQKINNTFQTWSYTTFFGLRITIHEYSYMKKGYVVYKDTQTTTSG